MPHVPDQPIVVPAPSTPRQNPARENKISPAAWGCLSVRQSSGLVGRGQRPVGIGSVWLGATARAPPVRDARAFRARGRPSFKRNSTQALGGLVAFGPSGTEHHPLPPGARRNNREPRQGLVRPAFAVTPQPLGGRPARAGLRIKRRRWQPSEDTVGGVRANAGSSAPSQAATGSGHSREMPSARSTSIRQAPALTGVWLRKLPARGYGPRPPELTASRRPGLRQPRPSVRDGRWEKCGTGGMGVEKVAGILGLKTVRQSDPSRCQDPSPTPPHKGEGLGCRCPPARSLASQQAQDLKTEKRSIPGQAPPPCGEGLGRGLV